MGVLADNRADVEAVAGALRAGADLLEGLLRSCCLLVAKGEILSSDEHWSGHDQDK